VAGDAEIRSRGLEFAILGPLRVTRDGAAVNLGGPQQRAVLALLLIDVDRPVSTDRIADALWGADRPIGYISTIQTYVFRLREVLEPGRRKGAPAEVLVTEGAGYRVDTSGAVLDTRVFEAGFADARRQLREGRPSDALSALEAALGLWRGDVLADMAELNAVAPLAARLSDLRLAAIEARIDAQLALGQHPVVAAELDSLVAAYPLREHLHAQRMLALYRCDRQSDALAAYRQLREVLDRDIGVAPGPPLQQLQHAILTHDKSLAAPSPVVWNAVEQGGVVARVASTQETPDVGATQTDQIRPAASRAGGRRHLGRRLAVTGVIVVFAASVVSVAAHHPDSDLLMFPGNSVGLIHRDGTVDEAVPVGPGPSALAYGAGSLWVANSGNDTVTRIDPRTHMAIGEIHVGRDPSGLAVTATDVWVVNSGDGTVSRINLGSPSAPSQTVTVGNQPAAIGYGPSGLWVANAGDNTIQRIDPGTGSVGAPIDVGGGPDGVTVAGSSIWVANGQDGTVTQVDAATHTPASPIQVGAGPTGITLAAGSIWVANSLEQSVSRIDPVSGTLAESIPDVGDGPTSIASDGHYLWVAAENSGSVVRIDPHNISALHRYRVGASPDALAADGSDIYVASQPFAAAGHVGGTLTVGQVHLPGSFTGIDPANVYIAWTFQPERLVYDGLVAFRYAGGVAGNTVVPDLASEMPTVSQDRQTYTFTLRTGVRYSTGAEVQATDFGYGFKRVFTVGAGGNPDFFDHIVGAANCLSHPSTCDLSEGVIPDNAHHQLTLRLTAPDPDLLSKLAYFVYPSPASTPLKQTTTPVPGTGPYQIASVRRMVNTTSKQVDIVFDTLVRNRYFHEWSFAAQPSGYPDKIEFTQVPDTPAATVAAVQAGKIDIAPLFGPDIPALETLVAGLRARYPSRVESQPIPAVTFEAFNTRLPPFNNVLARRAVNYAVDRQHVIDILTGADFATVSCQMLPRNFPSYVPYCPYTRPGPGYYNGPDLTKAQDLVTESGTRGMPVVVYDTVSEPASRIHIDYFASVLRELGYRVMVQAPALSPDSYNYPYDSRNRVQLLGLDGWNADYPSPANFYQPLLSCAAFRPATSDNYNLAEFCDPGIDRLAAQAATLARTDPGGARREWTNVDHAVTDAAPWVPLCDSAQVDFVSTKVGNYQSNAAGPVFDQIWVR
jgi:YVTN family beta-propeller protein